MVSKICSFHVSKPCWKQRSRLSAQSPPGVQAQAAAPSAPQPSVLSAAGVQVLTLPQVCCRVFERETSLNDNRFLCETALKLQRASALLREGCSGLQAEPRGLALHGRVCCFTQSPNLVSCKEMGTQEQNKSHYDLQHTEVLKYILSFQVRSGWLAEGALGGSRTAALWPSPSPAGEGAGLCCMAGYDLLSPL